jgi:hypothetical protein
MTRTTTVPRPRDDVPGQSDTDILHRSEAHLMAGLASAASLAGSASAVWAALLALSPRRGRRNPAAGQR